MLRAGRVGLEKEGLRVNSEGGLAQTPHPKALGAALTNAYITTDYSEAMLELITPPSKMSEATQFLRQAHQFVYTHIKNESLWVGSMPCVLAGETSIPLAHYGKSNAGNMKTVYRRGLGYRYGRVMQVIAGVHFNYSFSDEFWRAFQQHENDTQPLNDFIAERYFGLLRNLQRVGWLIPYLFGASPAVCKSFLHGQETDLEEFDASTYYSPYATSLRMGDIGYQNNKENEIGVKANYDGLDSYIDSLGGAIRTPSPRYEKIGVVVDGTYRQLNTNILQIENEYYSTVRPKQPPVDNEKPVLALKRRGVKYVELRSLDVNIFEPLGVNEPQLYFLEALMLFCLLSDSPSISDVERTEIDQNEMLTAHRGREPGLKLMRCGEAILMKEWASEIVSGMKGICEVLDQAEAPDQTEAPGKSSNEAHYMSSLQIQQRAVDDPELTPSAQMLAIMRERGEGFYHFARRMAEQHAGYFNGLAENDEAMSLFKAEAEKSLKKQKEIEAADTLSFDEYLNNYFAQR